MTKDKVRSFRIIIGFLTFLLLNFSLVQNVRSQQIYVPEINKTYRITLNDLSVVNGKLLSVNAKELVIFSETMGELRIQRENIKSMVQLSGVNEHANTLWFENPNPSKYLVGSSAIPLEKHTGYYQNTWIFVSSFGYAFTNNFSMAGGFEIISLLSAGEGPYAFYINPKASFKISRNFYAGGNILYANTLQTADDFGGLATINAFATYGNKNNNVTGAVGFGWADGVFAPRPLVVLSGMVRASRRIAFVSENWLVPTSADETNSFYNYYGIISYGIRFLGEKTSIDLAFINNRDIAETLVIGFPWLDFLIVF